MSARPHHVGSPYDKENAEWILAHFKEWGFDAHIETSTCSSPLRSERAAGNDRAHEVHGKAGGAGAVGGSDIESAKPSSSPPTTLTRMMAT